MSPYSHPLTAISNLDPYFKKTKDNKLVFIGDSLELRIPFKFKQHGALILTGDTVTTPGIMDMIINDKYHVGLNILASITIHPSDIGKFTYDGIDYITLSLKTNDVFMMNVHVLQDPHIVYVLWSEYITMGNVPYWVDYTNLLRLFEHAHELTGSGIGVSRSVFEGIIAHLARDADDIAKQYRLTAMDKPMQMVALNSVSNATSSSLARLNGSYFRDEGLTSALRRQIDEVRPFEQIVRGLPLYPPKDETQEG